MALARAPSLQRPQQPPLGGDVVERLADDPDREVDYATDILQGNLVLEDGDSIHIAPFTGVVTVSGQVNCAPEASM
mgnify:CR=1 FL=1